jgi:hypothetical protein
MTTRSSLRGEIVNKARLSLITGLTVKQIEALIAKGMPVLKAATGRGDDWEFATAQVVQWLASGKRPDGEAIDLNAERARLAKEQADGYLPLLRLPSEGQRSRVRAPDGEPERGGRHSERFGLGNCEKGIMTGRVYIPIHNADGRLVAYAGR